MPLTTLDYYAGDPGSLVSACKQALERLLLLSRGQAVPRCWIDYPYTEEEITLLEEVLPAMRLFLERVGEIDAALEAAHEAENERVQAAKATEPQLAA